VTSASAASSGLARQATAADRAELLVQALPYIQRFRGARVVVKYGGNAISGSDDLVLFAQDVVLMRAVGLKPIVVHGGGPQISALMARLGKQAEFRNGLRVTDAETVDIARMVLRGQVNPEIVSAINTHGPVALGVSGEDAGLIRAVPRDPELGYVGDIAAVDPTIVEQLLDQALIPVVATIGTDGKGQAYNINADTVAAHLAVALRAEKIIYLTDIEGLRRDVADPTSLIPQITAAELQRMVDAGELTGGMVPKVEACLHAVTSGVGRAHILDGRVPHVLLLELFTDEGIGTMIMEART
jgi:acetylglutamate kinase